MGGHQAKPWRNRPKLQEAIGRECRVMRNGAVVLTLLSLLVVLYACGPEATPTPIGAPTDTASPSDTPPGGAAQPSGGLQTYDWAVGKDVGLAKGTQIRQ